MVHTSVRGKIIRVVTAIRKSPRFIRLEGVKVGAVGRRLALWAVDKVVRGDVLPYSLGSPRFFPKNDDYTYDDFLIY